MDSDAPAYRFIVDRMLGRLIAWLRIFGYDTKSALDLEPAPNEDTLLIALAEKEGRILVSRDRALIERAKKAGVKAILVDSDDVREQLAKLLQHYRLSTDPNMTRCTACNSPLRKATASDLERIRLSSEAAGQPVKSHEGFWLCDHCGKVYWQGSHWRNILKTAENIKDSGKRPK